MQVDRSVRLSARLCWSLDARPWALLWVDATAALLFVFGCVAFYFPTHYSTGVTLFLIGSLLMLIAVLGRMLVRYGPAR